VSLKVVPLTNRKMRPPGDPPRGAPHPLRANTRPPFRPCRGGEREGKSSGPDKKNRGEGDFSKGKG
ncbi:hypothetical protein NDU88_002086, partial [Pleurodeles waltl]